MAESEDCQECHGTGISPGSFTGVCDACAGTGKVKVIAKTYCASCQEMVDKFKLTILTCLHQPTENH